MFCFCFFYALHQFFTSNFAVFVGGDEKNILCPGAQGTLATPLRPLRK